MEENLEQPVGSKENFGKFKDAESLLKAYANLESEFTKKSQRLAVLETEKNLLEQKQNKQADIDRKFEALKPFSSALKESLINDENAVLENEALKIISKNCKTAQDYVSDEEFLNNYIYSNKTIKEKAVSNEIVFFWL